MTDRQLIQMLSTEFAEFTKLMKSAIVHITDSFRMLEEEMYQHQVAIDELSNAIDKLEKESKKCLN